MQNIHSKYLSIYCNYHRYLEWISAVKRILLIWDEKFTTKNITYSTIIACVSCSGVSTLNNVSEVVGLRSVIPEFDYLETMNDLFISNLDTLSSYLIYGSFLHEDNNWELNSLLYEFSVQIPEDILYFIMKKICFNQDNGSSEDYTKLGSCVFCLHNSVSLLDLVEINAKLKEFLKPIDKNLKMLAFFTLENSKIFRSYLEKHKLREEEAQSQHSFSPSLYSLNSDVTVDLDDQCNISVHLFGKILEFTKESIHDILLGKATYSDIVSCNESMSKNYFMNSEVTILQQYVQYFKLSEEYHQGCKDVKSMLILFQYSHHIIALCEICKTFETFKNICSDSTLKPFIDIANELKTAGSKKLSTTQAKEKLHVVTAILGLSENLECIKIFSAILKNKEFYNFLYYHQYFGKEGNERFRQKYDLITAQLQHQDYNDTVLNHLLVAYTLMVPFLNPSSLKQLIQEIQSFSKGINQLKTVNENLTLILVWFSKAEVSSQYH